MENTENTEQIAFFGSLHFCAKVANGLITQKEIDRWIAAKTENQRIFNRG
jgi:hypothetical protein